jgi:AcrR family transcriptional regulator
VVGPKLHLFNAEHLARLGEIARLRAKDWPLARIRTHLLDFRAAPEPALAAGPTSEASVRERVLVQATAQFAARGYEAVRLDDMVRSLGISKATIYRHFASKQALFVAAVERVRFTLVPHAVRTAGGRTLEPREQGRRRAAAVLGKFSVYRSLHQLLGALAHGSDPRLARQARHQLHAMITNAEPFLKKLIDERRVRNQDPELLAYMLWGALMGAGECMQRESRFDRAEVLEAYLTFTELGMRGASG